MVPGVVGSGVWISHNLEVYGKDGKQEQNSGHARDDDDGILVDDMQVNTLAKSTRVWLFTVTNRSLRMIFGSGESTVHVSGVLKMVNWDRVTFHAACPLCQP